MKAFFSINIVCVLVLATSGCSLWGSTQNSERESFRPPTPVNSFVVPGQLINHPDVYSLQLFRSGSENSPPVIRLDSNQQLTLRFDMIESGTRQFRVTITHHNPDWTRSPLPSEEYMDGFSVAFFSGGRPSRDQRPAYFQYEYNFPNRQLRFRRSGNYMIRVEDFQSGSLIFSLPFFIYENEGRITSVVETLPVPRRDLRIRHIPKSTYEYPDFVELPQFDLEYYFTQNQFWGRMQNADIWDTATPGEVFFEVSRRRAFTGDYEVIALNLSDITRLGTLIREYRPDFVPARLLLDIDIQGLTRTRRTITGNRFGRPNPDPEARYGDIYFAFQPEQEIREYQRVYLVGDFTGWTLQGSNAMHYNEDSRLWETNTFIKEGSYSYKYVLKDGDRIYDLALDDTFTRTRQEYTSFVYYHDPVQRFYRLLQFNTFQSD